MAKLLEVFGIDPLCIVERIGEAWQIRIGAPDGEAERFETRGPYPSRAAALSSEGWYRYSNLPTWAGWQPGGSAWAAWTDAGATGPRPQLFEPVVVTGNPGLFLLASTARVDSFCKLEVGLGLAIGPHVHVASFCHLGIGGGLTILEAGSSCGSGAKVISGSNVYGPGHGCSAIAPDATVARSFVRICRNATLFAGAIVLPGVTVGENAVVAAGAVVLDDVPPYELWAGTPARFVKQIRPRPGGEQYGNRSETQ